MIDSRKRAEVEFHNQREKDRLQLDNKTLSGVIRVLSSSLESMACPRVPRTIKDQSLLQPRSICS